jgi:hypothetical protein
LEVAVCADCKVLIELDDCILTIAYNPHGKIDQQLSPRPIPLLNITLVSVSLWKSFVCAGRKVLIELDDCILTIAYDPHGKIDQQLSPHPIHLLNITLVSVSLWKSLCVLTAKS